MLQLGLVQLKNATQPNTSHDCQVLPSMKPPHFGLGFDLLSDRHWLHALHPGHKVAASLLSSNLVNRSQTCDTLPLQCSRSALYRTTISAHNHMLHTITSKYCLLLLSMPYDLSHKCQKQRSNKTVTIQVYRVKAL